MDSDDIYGTCECGHSWWEHHWSMKHTSAAMCMNCVCQLYSERGSSCFWMVKLYYKFITIFQPNDYLAKKQIELWIGDEVRHERERTDS